MTTLSQTTTVTRQLGFGGREDARAVLVRLLEAGEALRAASTAWAEALDRLPHAMALGLHAEVDGVDGDDVERLVDRLADRLGVPDDSEERRTVPVQLEAREALERADRIAASELEDVVERLVGVVSARVTPALAQVERALADDLRRSAEGRE